MYNTLVVFGGEGLNRVRPLATVWVEGGAREGCAGLFGYFGGERRGPGL